MPEERDLSDADRDLVARTIHDHACPSDPDAGCNWTEDGTECRMAEFEGFAGAVLDALTAAGKLTGRRVDDALAIHRPANDWSWTTFGCTHDGAHKKLCAECKTCYPCRTVIVLRGEIDG